MCIRDRPKIPALHRKSPVCFLLCTGYVNTAIPRYQIFHTSDNSVSANVSYAFNICIAMSVVQVQPRPTNKFEHGTATIGVCPLVTRSRRGDETIEFRVRFRFLYSTTFPDKCRSYLIYCFPDLVDWSILYQDSE